MGYPTEMVRAAILVAVAAGSQHVGEIDDRLTELGFSWSGRRPIYDHLHFLTRRGLLRAGRCRHDDDRRSHLLYELTEPGEEALGAWITDLGSLRAKLTEWSEHYASEQI